MEKLVELATDAGLPSTDESKFQLVTKVLWSHFEEHAKPASISRPDLVLVKAYKIEGVKKKRRFGDLIVENLDKFDDTTGDHKATNRCADLCGTRATKEALDSGDLDVDENVFERAFTYTETRTSSILKRARRIARKRGRTLRGDTRGNGC